MIPLSKITFKEALGQIFNFFIGNSEYSQDTETEVQADSSSTVITCARCGNKMKVINTINTDFVDVTISICNECGLISESQHKDGVLMKMVHMYQPISSSEFTMLESTDIMPFENFSLSRLWCVCGKLCYPSLIRSDFPENGKVFMCFIKMDSRIDMDDIDGYIINSNNIIGEVHLTREQTLSFFHNPYISNLPKKDFSYLTIPTERCENIEAVLPIRYQHKQSTQNNFNVHQIYIIKDNPIRCVGYEVYVRFIRYSSERISMIETFQGINLKAIITGELPVEVDEGFSLQTFNLTKHTLSASIKSQITQDEKESFYESIIEFFQIYDRYHDS